MFTAVCSRSNPNTTGKPLPKRAGAPSQKTRVILLSGEESGPELAEEVQPPPSWLPRSLYGSGGCAALQVAPVLWIINSVVSDAIINPLPFKGTKFT